MRSRVDEELERAEARRAEERELHAGQAQPRRGLGARIKRFTLDAMVRRTSTKR